MSLPNLGGYHIKDGFKTQPLVVHILEYCKLFMSAAHEILEEEHITYDAN